MSSVEPKPHPKCEVEQPHPNLYLSGAAILALTAKGNFGDALTALQAMQFGGPTIFAAKFAIAFPFTYHLFNGIRHLVSILAH